ncbi:hypothetical protein Q31b_12000 [Novipirellula aureliae]|uniref:Uncharacterized protein n=1 Tax=Novipirellula aureliae TaxID=2527966 RepID=A0A5C6EAJ5_9BACT|nr:hypothetical protein [Novipirellula aureliae]TWU46022.1 hypothetical protein Q31b_12000 [Novipirellula aureliae]
MKLLPLIGLIAFVSLPLLSGCGGGSEPEVMEVTQDQIEERAASVERRAAAMREELKEEGM